MKIKKKSSFHKLAKYSFIIWSLSLIIFFALILLATEVFTVDASRNPFGSSSIYQQLVFYTIFVGVLSFLLGIGFTISDAIQSHFNFGRMYIVFTICVALMCSSFVAYFFFFVVDSSNESSSLPTSFPTPTPHVVLLPSPSLAANPTTKPKAYDPVIDCESSATYCKGASIRVRQSQCSKITCCQVGNTWSVYPTNDACTEAQKGSQSQVVVPKTSALPSTNRVPVFLTYSKYTINCPPQNVDAVKSIDATMTSKSTEWAKKAVDCQNNFYNTDSCYVSCKETQDVQVNWCRSNIAQPSEDYEACLEASRELYPECIKNCPSSSTACDWVYAEQKSLSSQINNLCK